MWARAFTAGMPSAAAPTSTRRGPASPAVKPAIHTVPGFTAKMNHPVAGQRSRSVQPRLAQSDARNAYGRPSTSIPCSSNWWIM
ncbi:MAG TPA: hypothetical protein VIL20_15535 [Sandaracinaceae bacterium]